MCPKTPQAVQVCNEIVNRLALFLSPSVESRSFEDKYSYVSKISLEFVEYSFPFRSGGKELGKRPFCLRLLGSDEFRISQMAFVPRSGMGCHHVVAAYSIDW